ncbi:hypothetical protein TRFO_28143 [Tritrichomonas foetus]|uniref:Uncharacterized protein n=1 Tax=Tritrichomonas foetus TaxID=1144522 RepID=A0A1J4JYT5_9EUKA|nr:hypothetical protein TRFO_28143 [Tritrichomonas foetus]|eukprot:OHT04327.1 hypothetical protein TRFO_28143 [Tritrichomonas foetus]
MNFVQHQNKKKLMQNEIFDFVFRIGTTAKVDEAAVEKVCSILTRAYSDRAVSIQGSLINNMIYIGIYLNANADFNREIEPGPHPKSPEAASFREFWGNDKSTLRRFPDGSLLESLGWGPEPLKEIAEYALQKHFAPDATIDIAPRDLSPIFDLPQHENASTANHASLNSISDAYDELVMNLRNLKLTVGITSVSPLSPFLRKTSVFPYEAVRSGHNVSLCPNSIRILARLETSSAWPLRLEPLLQFKIAIYIEMAKLLNEKKITAIPHYEGVQILFRGFVFNLQAVHEDEIRHFHKTPHGTKIEFLERLEVRHHSFVSALGARFDSYPEAVRAAIRWVRSKGVVSKFLSQEAIELMVASAYTTSSSSYSSMSNNNEKEVSPPAYSMAGFLRFLEILKNLPVKSPIITVGDARPNSDALTLPLAIVSNYCEGSEFTKKYDQTPKFNQQNNQNSHKNSKIIISDENSTIPKIVVDFLRKAAAQSLRIALEGRFAPRVPLLRQMFGIPTSHWNYDFSISSKNRPHAEYSLFAGIDKKKRRHGRFDIKSKTAPELADLFVDLDPPKMLVEEVIERFSGVVNFWYDELGGQAIGMSFADNVLRGKDMKVENLKFAQKTDETMVAVDIEGIAQQVVCIGGDIITGMNHR